MRVACRRVRWIRRCFVRARSRCNGPHTCCHSARMTAVGFEPTPLRTGALSQRLRPLGQTVLAQAAWGSNSRAPKDAPRGSRAPIRWTHWGLNPGPSACKADVIPLHHVPGLRACAPACCSQEFARGVCGSGAPRPRSRWMTYTLATANWHRSFLFHRTRCRVPGRALSVREVRSRVPPWAAYFCARSSSLRGTTLGPLARHALLTANHALLARAGAGIGCVCRASHPCGRGNSAISDA